MTAVYSTRSDVHKYLKWRRKGRGKREKSNRRKNGNRRLKPREGGGGLYNVTALLTYRYRVFL
jgi:hypothetical protein